MAEARERTAHFAPRGGERPVGNLLSDLARQSGLLLRQEVALAKAEMFGKVSALGSGIGLLAAGGVLAFAGLLYLLAAAMFGLSYVVELWLAALIVGIVVVGIGAMLALVGRKKLQAENLVPHRTVQSLKDDASWAREQVQ